MRVYLIWFFAIFLCFYSWKDWYKVLCVLVVMLAIVERPDMPKTVLGIPGLNPWNLILLNVLASYAFSKQVISKALTKDKIIHLLFVIYMIFLLILTLRGFKQIDGVNAWRSLYGGSINLQDMIIDDLFNTLKYVVVAYLFYIGATNEKNIKLGVYAVLLLNALLAIQVIRWMPLSALTNGDLLQRRSMRVLDREIGYYRSDLAVLLGGAAWAFFAIKSLVKNRFYYYSSLFGSFLATLATALTGSRIGVGVWLAVAVVLSWYKYRQFLLLAPLGLVVVLATVPAVQERLMQGFSADDQEEGSEYSEHMIDSNSNINTASVTSGRTIIWPHVLDNISESIAFGQGRHSHQSSGLAEYLLKEHRELFPHPHNAYLELLQDGGLFFSVPIFLFYFYALVKSIKLIKIKDNEFKASVGGISFAFLFGQIVGALAGQSFYPMISQISMWVMIFLLLRTLEIQEVALQTESEPLKKTKQYYQSQY